MADPLTVATVITRMSSGAGLMVLRGARSLDPDRFRVTVIAGSGDRLLAEAAAAGLEVVTEPLLRRPIRPHVDWRARAALTRLFAARRFDVVHTHCAKAGAVGRSAAARAGVPRIVHTYHGLPFHRFQPAAVRAAYVGVERRLGRVTDVALCVGEAVAAEAVRRELLPSERIRALGVAVDPPRPAGPADRLRARAALGLPADAVVVGAVGRLAYQKAPEDFVAAVRAMGRTGVVGVWIGDGELAQSMRRMAERSAVDIRFVGERTDVLDLLAAFDVFVLSSRYEGLPIALVEAMAAGLPVVATAVDGVTDVVVPGHTGLLVPPHRPQALAAGIERMILFPADASRMAAAGRRRVHGPFTESALALSVSAAYSPAAATRCPIDEEFRPYTVG